MKKQIIHNALVKLTKSALILLVVSACTKSRTPELPEAESRDIYAIDTFGDTSVNSPFNAKVSSTSESDTAASMQALDIDNTQKLSSDDVSVPARIKFMFDNLPLSGLSASNFKITFTVDKNNLTAYKVVQDASELSALEKGLAISETEAKLLNKISKSATSEMKAVVLEQKSARTQRDLIVSGQQKGALLVPMFKYTVEAYGVLERTKNELKEDTAVLTLRDTDFKKATHIKLSSKADSRLSVGLNPAQIKEIKQLFVESKIDNQLMTASQLSSSLKIGLNFIKPDAKVLTRLDSDKLLVYELTDISKLSETQLRLLKNNASTERIKKCSDADVASIINSSDANCVIILSASLPISFKKPELALAGVNGETSSDINLTDVPRTKSVGLVEIAENTTATQEEVASGQLDPNGSIKISDLTGEFFFRRTFESAASSFLGRTGTSGDMAIVKFELEDSRIVVRSQQSLIQYTGQGAQDREEIMSLPVKYLRVVNTDANGVKLSIPKIEETTKEKADYAQVSWLDNTIPDATSPLAFFDGGACFRQQSSQKVTSTDMRLAQDGVLNFSISSSYTVDPSCAAIKDVNSAYWAGMAQYNYNVQERISFVKHANQNTDKQFALNISPMAQEAFNFGVFTLADKVTDNRTLDNRDGSERYMPMVHDFRNGRIVKWYLGGINDSTATSTERRKLLVSAAQEVINEWNVAFKLSFKGTSLERSGDYVQLIVEDPGQETGHLGDLDKNYIWFNEITADNGLLGVAQPAANPRSGIIESANVIIYTGNTFDQVVALLKSTKISREYENKLKDIRESALKNAQKQNDTVNGLQQVAVENSKTSDAASKDLQQTLLIHSTQLKNIVESLALGNQDTIATIKQLKIAKNSNTTKYSASSLKNPGQHKGQKINLASNKDTLTKKITDLAMNRNLTARPHELEFRVNDLMIAYGDLSEQVKTALNKRQNELSMAIKFEKATNGRPGCFMYERNDIEDQALSADKDPETNLMINFKQSVKSTLAHELGHAFGLLHNFTASTDKANFEFPGEKTGRNYSSIMDYIADIDMNYVGLGPYDVQAIRAAYTGLVPLSSNTLNDQNLMSDINDLKIKVYNNNLIAIPDVMKLMNQTSLVQFRKNTVNQTGLTQHFAQCSDGGIATSAMCQQFDVGGSATEIVKNKIADYNRTYAGGSYINDRIMFGWPQKMRLIQRNIMNFQQIRSFLDELFTTAYIKGTGRTDEDSSLVITDLQKATLEGYKFFHEVIRTGQKYMSASNLLGRISVVPYSYKKFALDENGQIVIGQDGQPTIEKVNDFKVLESRSVYDVYQDNQELIDTIGISYDKVFAMSFLMQASSVNTVDDSQYNMISYVDFEKMMAGISDPADSLTIKTVINILTNNLTTGFFAPTDQLQFINVGEPIDTVRQFGDQTAIAAVIGLSEAKWDAFDAYAEAFKVGRAYQQNAPKDRINVARLEEQRKLSDTTVYYAAQNAVAANVIVQQAAYGEVLLNNRDEVFKQMKVVSQLDQPILAAADKSKKIDLVNACKLDDKGQVIDKVQCKAISNKSLFEYAKSDATLSAAMKKADDEAKKLAGIFRKLNNREILMPKSIDVAGNRFNFDEQVKLAREQIYLQTSLIERILSTLESTPKEKLRAEYAKLKTAATMLKSQVDAISFLPVIELEQLFVAKESSSKEITLTNGATFGGQDASSMIIDDSKLTESHSKIVDVLDKLSIYTRFIDPDFTQTQ